MNMNDIRDRFRALKAVLKPETATGMHAHHNRASGGELVVAVEEGAIALTPARPGWGGAAMRRWRCLPPPTSSAGAWHRSLRPDERGR